VNGLTKHLGSFPTADARVLPQSTLGKAARYLVNEYTALGGYLRDDDDWQDEPGAKLTHFISNGYRAELDYYVQRGFAVMARYDRMKQTVAAGPATHTGAWRIGGEKALTDMGNVVLRATYGQERDQDPVSGSTNTDKLFQLDVRLMW